MGVKRIGHVGPSFGDASSWYRGAGPWLRLEREGLVENKFFKEISWVQLLQCDVIVMMRPTFPTYLPMVGKIKRLGLPLWIDHDDDLLRLPKYHPDFNDLASDAAKNATAEILGMADVVTLSTPALLKSYQPYVDKKAIAEVIPNAIDESLAREPTPQKKISKVISWRGGKTHEQDVSSVLGEMNILVKNGFRFIFMGAKLTCIHSPDSGLPIGTFSELGTCDPDDMGHNMKNINARYHITPLVKSALNECKSNISWLESTWFGGSVNFAPAIYEETWFESALYDNKENTLSKIVMEVDKNPELAEAFYDNSIEVIRHKYLLGVTNELRKEILKNF